MNRKMKEKYGDEGQNETRNAIRQRKDSNNAPAKVTRKDNERYRIHSGPS